VLPLILLTNAVLTVGVGKAWSNRISALAMVSPYFTMDKITSRSFAKFLRRRARIWSISSAPVNTVLALPTKAVVSDISLVNRVSSPALSGGVGGPDFIFPDHYDAILEWLYEVHMGPFGKYCNPELNVVDWVEPVMEPQVAFRPKEQASQQMGFKDAAAPTAAEEEEEKVAIAGVEIPKSLAERAGLI
jgi:hypothetical protein